ncbi:MBL fold metallo-hydrolase [Denitrobacterium detoxificans]|uniref:Glyoxylase, beta-lactamase superfamily II n=1 Tax=Denitrobacterium detoxificans TaxID=79604 RepID=A0A1H8TRC7_9ACTN|nr:MBL fold metallo-hydrolase [Denitrobacterium detoxificans]SEO93580.1 Glyoxylase, beta-lactamase superfamily II [Denitrobacterium detoxificans]
MNPQPIEEIRPRIWRVQVPLPDNPLRFLNSYFILGDDKTTIVDVGFDNQECSDTLDAALAYFGRSWDTVEVILTHSHPDHTGCLDRLWTPGMTIHANMHSFQEVSDNLAMEAEIIEPVLEHIVGEKVGLAGGSGGRDGSRTVLTSELLPLKKRPNFHFLDDGDEFEAAGYTFRVVATPGHDNWHICLYEPTARLLIAGDTVLERITPTVSTWLTSRDNLGDFLSSLHKLGNLDIDLALAGHGEPFEQVHERLAFLLNHHAQRLEEIDGLVAEGYSTLADIARNCAWKHANWDAWSLQQKYFSLGETLAHLVHLMQNEHVACTICGNDMRFTSMAHS